MISKEKLKDYASKLMFDMEDSEYETLQSEFEIILKQMDLIGQIEGISEVEPMTFPYVIYHAKLRDDVVKDELTKEEVLYNAKQVKNEQVMVPKVVE
ncbi:MAG: Asp-tRNA(Asn)/Glu-tRNA(Gln) amidotransferase subunit GatC [Mollicutes bacterium]|jgi:aspartyl-tRNA(Asn)/glutamyl-tRNA(Gln) amidotransferase subunit C|nr:Asp-tRNA(Asn)/Glu-tRNA(Gln) amidotransferase subunit GatC [Mollicutes bacterium]